MTKWRQIADEIAAEIRNGTREPGSELPQIRDLVRAGRGSTATVHRAYKSLEARGYVESVRGHGTVVRPLPVRVPLYRHNPKKVGGRATWESAVSEAGFRGLVRADPPEYVAAPPEVAAALGVEMGTPVLHIRQHIAVGKDVIQLDEAWYPEDLAEAAGLDGIEMRTATPLGFLTRAGLLSGAREHVQVEVHTDPEEMPEPPGWSTVLRVDRVTQDSSGRTVEFLSTLADAARVRLTYSLPLSRAGQPASDRKLSSNPPGGNRS